MWHGCEVCGKGLTSLQRKYCSDACKMKAYRRKKDPLVGSPIRNHERLQNAVRTKASMLIDATCEQCGHGYTHDGNQALQMYCSDACKQKAYRARKKEASANWSVGMPCLTDLGREATIKAMRGTRACIVSELIGERRIDRYHTLKRLSPVTRASGAPIVEQRGIEAVREIANENAELDEYVDALRCGAGIPGVQAFLEGMTVAYQKRYGFNWRYAGGETEWDDGFLIVVDGESYYMKDRFVVSDHLKDYYYRGVANNAMRRAV